MIKTEYIIIVVIAIVVIAGVGFVAYDQGMLKGSAGNESVSATPVPTIDDDETIVAQPVSAMTALSTIEGNSKFKDWKKGKTDVLITDISSQSGINGLSDTWAFTFVSKGEQAVVLYDTGRIQNIIKTPLQDDVSTLPGLVPDRVIDSDKAFTIATGNITAQGIAATGQASLELSPQAQNTSNWDIIYPVVDGFYLVRLDSASGSVLESKHYNSG